MSDMYDYDDYHGQNNYHDMNDYDIIDNSPKYERTIMQLAQVPADGQKYDVVATITNLTQGTSVGQKGSMMQKFDLADASKAVKGVAYFYMGNQPDMALPPNWNGQTMPVSVSAKQNGQYTNYTASIPKTGAQFAGGNQSHAAPIQQAMANQGVQYAEQQPAQAVDTTYPSLPNAVTKPEPDWDEIARGKVRCNLICSLLQNSAFDPNMVEPTQKLAEQYMNYIFTGQVGLAPPSL